MSASAQPNNHPLDGHAVLPLPGAAARAGPAAHVSLELSGTWLSLHLDRRQEGGIHLELDTDAPRVKVEIAMD